MDVKDRVEMREKAREEEEARLASARSLESQPRNFGRLDDLVYKRLSSIKHRDSGSEAHDLLGQVIFFFLPNLFNLILVSRDV